MACLIGITCSWQEQESRHLINDSYILAVQEAGGIPLLIPTLDPALAEEVYHRMDAIIFSGGDDPDPYLYGEEPQEGLGDVTPRRDSFELALTKYVLGGRKPALGICRGIQVLNIAAGGTLWQDLKGYTALQHRQLAPRWHTSHLVDIDNDSRLFRITKHKSIRVNSFHHQAVKEVGEGLRAVARSRDGIIEALESENPQKYIIGMQWHPEFLLNRDEYSLSIFRDMVEEAKKVKKGV